MSDDIAIDDVTIDYGILDFFVSESERLAVEAKRKRRVRHDRLKIERKEGHDLLRGARRAYQRGNVMALWDALEFSRNQNRVEPWMVRGMLAELEANIYGHARGTGRHAQRRRQFADDMKDYLRWMHVLDAAARTGWTTAYDEASRRVARTIARGTPAAMKKAYERVTARRKTHPERYYLPRYILPRLS